MDKDVDLTLEKKFSKGLPFNNKGDKTYLFRKSRYEQIDFFDTFHGIRRSSVLPWNKKINTLQNDDTRKIRSYGDLLSDEFGSTIRCTEDNNILDFGNKFIHPEVTEEFFMETIGSIPYSNINMCMRCGKKSIKHMTSFMFSECGNHTRIPRKWEIDL